MYSVGYDIKEHVAKSFAGFSGRVLNTPAEDVTKRNIVLTASAENKERTTVRSSVF